MRHTANPEDAAFRVRVSDLLAQTRVQHTVFTRIIVNAMKTFTKSGHNTNKTLVETAG